eukprot:gb/GECG01000516.1/.p1 GENE.gb/GECG01000516.1/~~gb/GECG01000516.1/.p1  ORF type:complete len:429 (+),score=61.63 gb/GECG01000516.1/:1-1287(+)
MHLGRFHLSSLRRSCCPWRWYTCQTRGHCSHNVVSKPPLQRPRVIQIPTTTIQTTSRCGYFSSAIYEQLEALKRRYEELDHQLTTNQLQPEELPKVSREHNELSKAVEVINRLENKKAEEEELNQLIENKTEQSEEDQELVAMAHDELPGVQEEVAELEDEVRRLLLPRDEMDRRDAILEVRAGTGGEEACLFASELFQMYAGASKLQDGWSFKEMEVHESSEGGVREASAEVSGTVYGKMKFEIGTHRVQRVPKTESGGRLHTSAATVAVLPRAEAVEVEIRDADLRIDTFRSSGAGGQHVNTTDSAVRITHLPTGTVVACQSERSQHRNRSRAMQALRTKIFEEERRKQQQQKADMRRSQLGSGDRSERIRTYNFAQDRVTDHRIGLTKHGIERMLRGEMMDEFWTVLQKRHEDEMLAQLEDEGTK